MGQLARDYLRHDNLSTLVLHLPLMFCPASQTLLSETVLDSKYPECITPTTCCSVIGDDECDVQSLPDSDFTVSEGSCYDDVKLVVKNTFVEFRCLDEESAPKLRRQKSEPALAYAPFTLIEAAKSSSASSWADISELDSSDAKSKSRRSGRARQREQRRRRMRTPSPEMRYA